MYCTAHFKNYGAWHHPSNIIRHYRNLHCYSCNLVRMVHYPGQVSLVPDSSYRSIIDIRIARRIPSQRRTGDDRLPLYHNQGSSEGQYIWARRRMLVEDTFGSFPLADWTHLPTSQQNGRIFDIADPRWLIARYLMSDLINRCIVGTWRWLQIPDVTKSWDVVECFYDGCKFTTNVIIMIELWVLWSMCRDVREFGVMAWVIAG